MALDTGRFGTTEFVSIAAILRTPGGRALAMAAALAWSTGAFGELPGALSEVLAQHRLPAESISLLVTTTDGRVLLEHLADTPRNPASVMKLVTSYAALDLLGPAYTWRTDFRVDALPRDGVVDGNLYITGGGDPMILVEDFLHMLLALRQRGIRHVTGDLVVDDRYFDEASIDRSPIDEQPERAYNAWPASLVVNFRATRFVLVPGADRVEVIAEPPSTTLTIDNRLRAVAGPCQRRNNHVQVEVSRRQPVTVRVSGRYGVECGEYAVTRSVLDADAYLLGVFQALWSALGGRFDGTLVHGPAPVSARTVLAHDSPPLADVLQGVNKFSNNLMARSLLLTLGAEIVGPPGSVDAGRVAIADWLHRRGLSLPHLVIDNGAGLSRDARITARGLADLLVDARGHPFADEFAASLSLVGIDGSTRRRLHDHDETGRYRLKTGLLRDVRAAAGYGTTGRGTALVLVMLHNAPGLTYASGNAVQDAVLSYLYRHY